MTVKPRTEVPELSFERTGGGSWQLSEQQPGQFTIVVFYRGHH